MNNNTSKDFSNYDFNSIDIAATWWKPMSYCHQIKNQAKSCHKRRHDLLCQPGQPGHKVLKPSHVYCKQKSRECHNPITGWVRRRGQLLF